MIKEYTTQTYLWNIHKQQCVKKMAYWRQNNIFNYLAVPTRRYITMKFKIADNTAKYNFSQRSYLQTVFISVSFTMVGAFRIVAKSAFVFLLCSVLFVSGPAHILCLIVASGWNKERCIPEILSLSSHRTSYSVLGASCYNSSIRYSIWLMLSPNISAFICNSFALEEFNDYNHYRNTKKKKKLQFIFEFKSGNLFSQYPTLIFILVPKLLVKYDKTCGN